MTDAVKALYGEWRPVSGPGFSPKDRLTIWSPMFSFGSGCELTQGQLRDLGDGRYALDDYTRLASNCQTHARLAPFDTGEVRIVAVDDDTIRIERGGEAWMFEKVDVAATIPRDDFVRGDWLLADRRGRPYRGEELTRVTFGPEYKVDAENCDFASNSWFTDRDGEVRTGGSYYRMSEPCRVQTLGDELAKLGAEVNYRANPVETRMTVRIGREWATLVPAARYPELAEDAEAFMPHPWAAELAEKAAAMPAEQRVGLALRAIGFGGEGMPGTENPADPRALAFVGMTTWHYAQAQQAGLVPEPGTEARSLAEHFAIAPIVVRAVLEGIRPVDRGDGLSLDYLYRVREGWRGGNQTGDLLIVRMPPLEGKSRSPVITPEPGEEVLLLASRTGYLAGRLTEGDPPSFDTRLVQMTLPLMRIVDGKLAEAVEGANVLGAASYVGTKVEDARALAVQVDQRIAQIAPPRPTDNFGNPIVRRYFISRVGDRVLADPTRLWIDYDGRTKFGNPNGYGGVTAFYDGCAPVGLIREGGRTMAFANAIACPGNLPDGNPITERAVDRAAQWINANHFPDVICVSTCPTDPEYTVPLPEGDVILKAMLR
ncbi:hypothetical protein [Croceicoccus gelatinilyticus]|uniref:hypothetical protein n=1 Tax=Croceicoccus gelatinilyticus TaxID=2835536 RepID=UPI001BCC6AE4|nr:hypothetical protein [Croceicoccus gelatinilyticus]MBS7670935.1 hypothetical protein [Croceicoccus gelatinilyticus]